MTTNEMEYNLNAEVIKFEGIFAVLKISDGQEIKWPIKNLPDDVKEGKQVRLILSSEESEIEAQEKLARAVLNNILSG